MSQPDSGEQQTEKTPIWDNPRNVNILVWALVAACVAVAAADLFYVKKIHFNPENIIAAYGIDGFLCFVFIVFAGKFLRVIVMRDEDYYDR